MNKADIHQQRKQQALRPWKRLTATYSVLALITAIALNMMYPQGQTSWISLLLISAVPFFSVAENLAEYRLSDEYERSLMLRAVGFAALSMMIAAYILALVLINFTLTPRASAVSAMAIHVLGWVIYSVVRSILRRREARE